MQALNFSTKKTGFLFSCFSCHTCRFVFLDGSLLWIETLAGELMVGDCLLELFFRVGRQGVPIWGLSWEPPINCWVCRVFNLLTASLAPWISYYLPRLFYLKLLTKIHWKGGEQDRMELLNVAIMYADGGRGDRGAGQREPSRISRNLTCILFPCSSPHSVGFWALKPLGILVGTMDSLPSEGSFLLWILSCHLLSMWQQALSCFFWKCLEISHPLIALLFFLVV